MDDYRTERISVWTALLIDGWETSALALAHAGYPRLRRPNFLINPRISHRFGSWDAQRRIIELGESLFLEYETDAVIEVLRHEIAHQVVSETPGGPIESDHGPRWRQACKVLGCDASATTCDDALRLFTQSPRSQLLERINKLLTHGHCESVTRAESETFLAKARQLMLKNQIEQSDIDETTLHRQAYIQRPIGPLFKRLPGYYHALGNLLADHYFVNYIQTHTRIFFGSKREWRTRLELFGTLDNVDVADYVACQLLAQAESIWSVERVKLRRPQRGAFFFGLFDGFAATLTAGKDDEAATITDMTRALIHREHTHRQTRYAQAYPQVSGGHVSYSAGDSHGAGLKKGAEIRIREGVKGRSSEVKLLR